MTRRITALCFMVVFMLSGCAAASGRGDIRSQMVTRVQVQSHGSEESIQRNYIHTDKIRMCLLALRTLGPDFPAMTDVDALQGKTLVIRMYCADDSVITYRIKNNLYLQKNDGPWRRINIDQFAGFWQMVVQMASDEIPNIPTDPLAGSAAHRVYFPARRKITRG